MSNTSKVTYITPIGAQAIIGVESVEIGGETVMSVTCRNWRKLSVGDEVTIAMVAGYPTIMFTYTE